MKRKNLKIVTCLLLAGVRVEGMDEEKIVENKASENPEQQTQSWWLGWLYGNAAVPVTVGAPENPEDLSIAKIQKDLSVMTQSQDITAYLEQVKKRLVENSSTKITPQINANIENLLATAPDKILNPVQHQKIDVIKSIIVQLHDAINPSAIELATQVANDSITLAAGAAHKAFNVGAIQALQSLVDKARLINYPNVTPEVKEEEVIDPNAKQIDDGKISSDLLVELKREKEEPVVSLNRGQSASFKILEDNNQEKSVQVNEKSPVVETKTMQEYCMNLIFAVIKSASKKPLQLKNLLLSAYRQIAQITGSVISDQEIQAAANADATVLSNVAAKKDDAVIEQAVAQVATKVATFVVGKSLQKEQITTIPSLNNGPVINIVLDGSQIKSASITYDGKITKVEQKNIRFVDGKWMIDHDLISKAEYKAKQSFLQRQLNKLVIQPLLKNIKTAERKASDATSKLLLATLADLIQEQVIDPAVEGNVKLAFDPKNPGQSTVSVMKIQSDSSKITTQQNLNASSGIPNKVLLSGKSTDRYAANIDIELNEQGDPTRVNFEHLLAYTVEGKKTITPYLPKNQTIDYDKVTGEYVITAIFPKENESVGQMLAFLGSGMKDFGDKIIPKGALQGEPMQDARGISPTVEKFINALQADITKAAPIAVEKVILRYNPKKQSYQTITTRKLSDGTTDEVTLDYPMQSTSEVQPTK